jgi:catechol 2,3-dioxygenase-like lactoylglutathione lyase family enzyme
MPHPNQTVLRTPPAYPQSALPPFIQPLERPTPLVKARSLAFLMFEKPDLAATEAFLRDFGMRTVFRDVDQLQMRGSGSEPCIYLARRGSRSRYLGAAFTVASEAELAIALKAGNARRILPGHIPGGGDGVELVDPAGNLLWLVTGQRAAEPLPLRAPLHPLTNGPGLLRRVNATVRPPLEPAAVARL